MREFYVFTLFFANFCFRSATPFPHEIEVASYREDGSVASAIGASSS